MTVLTSRRGVLRGVAASALGLAIPRAMALYEGRDRKFTMDLVCGNIGVNAHLPEAIRLAAEHGFESLAPEAGFLKSASESQLSELKQQLMEGKLVWGAAGLSVDFRRSQADYESGLKGLAGQAEALRRAGRDPHGHLDHADAR